MEWGFWMEITEYVEKLSRSSEGWEKFETKPKEKICPQ